MNPDLTRYLITGAFLLNGIGMLGAALTLPVALQKPDQPFGHSWILRRFGTQTEAVVGTVLWGLAGIGFIGAGVGYFLDATWWTYFAWVGAPANITWAATNVGNGTTGNGRPSGTISAWSDRVVLSRNSTYGDGDDVLLANVPRASALTAGEGYAGSYNGALPAGLSGSPTAAWFRTAT